MFQPHHLRAQIHPNKLLRAVSKIILFQSQTFGKSNFKSITVWLDTQAWDSEDYHNGPRSPERDHSSRKPSSPSSSSTFRERGRRRKCARMRCKITSWVSKESCWVPSSHWRPVFGLGCFLQVVRKVLKTRKGKISANPEHSTYSLVNTICQARY